MTLKKQLIITLFLVGLIPFAIMGISSYITASEALNKEGISKLEMARELKKHELKTYIGSIDAAIHNLGQSRDTVMLFKELVELHKKYEVGGSEPFDIIDKPDVKEVYAKYQTYFNDFMKENKLYDVFMICKPHGHVMYSVTKESDLGANLKTGSLSDSGLAKAWSGAVRTNHTVFIDMAPYAPSGGAPAMFMATPIINLQDNEVLGVVAVQLSLEVVNDIMQNRTGMGESGESYLVGQDKLMRSDSFLDPTNHTVVASFKNPSQGSVDTEGAREALSGKTDTKIIIDYNGNPVLSSYTLVDFFGTKWALLAEIDESEIFAPVFNLRNTAIIMGIVFLVIIVGVAFMLANFVSKPIINAVQVISDGNSQIVSASTEISSSATSLAEGATQQASSVEEVSATVEESTAINNQNAQNSKEADSLSKDASESANRGNEKIEALMVKMSGISESSDKIAKIIKTIDEIAFQTNLLALNAAVEAARAGEHGLGFAVVAEEVKSLASRSANAAKETADIIEGSIEQVKSGNEMATQTNEAFKEIVDKIKKTSHLISEISISANEQAEGMNQIASAMGQIDEVTQQNAAVSEEAAAAAEQLNAQAISMMDSVVEVGKIVGLDLENSTSSNVSNRKALIHKEF